MLTKFKNKKCGCIYTYNWHNKVLTSILSCKVQHLKVIFDLRKKITGGAAEEVESLFLSALYRGKIEEVHETADFIYHGYVDPTAKSQ